MDASVTAWIISGLVLISVFLLPVFRLRRVRRERCEQPEPSELVLGYGPGGASISSISAHGPFADLESLRAAQYDRPMANDRGFGSLGRLLQPTADGFWEILLTPGPSNTIAAMWFRITEELYEELCEVAVSGGDNAGYGDPSGLWCSPELSSLEALRQSAGVPPIDPDAEMSLFIPMETIGRLEELRAFQRAWLEEEGDVLPLGRALLCNGSYFGDVILVERPSGSRMRVHFNITEELFELMKAEDGDERRAN
jgi:hypothetical protein